MTTARPSYKKRIASWKTSDGKAISLWVEVQQSVKTAWSVYFNYRHLFKFSSEAPARAKCLEILANDGHDFRPSSAFPSKAAFIDQNPSVAMSEELYFGLLVELEMISAREKGLSEIRLGMRRTLAQRLAGLAAIPRGAKAAEGWASELCQLLQEQYKTQATFVGRLSLIFKVLDVISQYPIVFAGWASALAVIKARLKVFRIRKKGGLVKEVNRPPYTLTELCKLLNEQKSFDSALLLLVYLQYGFRAREAERLRPEHGVSGRLDLSSIVTKTKTDKQPPLFLLTKAALRCIELGHVSLDTTPLSVDRKRLRPTAVVMLTLSGQDVLSIIQRTGHKDVRMLVSHYAKFMPSDFKIGQTMPEYLELDLVELGGQPLSECIWDQWLLAQALQAAHQYGADWFIAAAKTLHIGQQAPTGRRVVSF